MALPAALGNTKSRPNDILVRLIKIIGLALTCSIVIYATQDQVHIKTLFAARIPPRAQSEVRFETISLAETLQLFHDPDAIFLDVRPAKYYLHGHIEGAVNLAVDTISQLSEQRLRQLRDASAIVIYCGDVSCGTAYLASRELNARGVRNIKIYPQGWSEWRSCGLPVSMSDQMKHDPNVEKQ